MQTRLPREEHPSLLGKQACGGRPRHVYSVLIFLPCARVPVGHREQEGACWSLCTAAFQGRGGSPEWTWTRGWVRVEEVQHSYCKPSGNIYMFSLFTFTTLIHWSLSWCTMCSMVPTYLFPNSYPIVPVLFSTKSTFIHWLEYPCLSYINVPHTPGPTSGFCLLFHWAVRLFRCHSVLTTKALWWVLRTGETNYSPPNFSSILGFLRAMLAYLSWMNLLVYFWKKGHFGDYVTFINFWVED